LPFKPVLSVLSEAKRLDGIIFGSVLSINKKLFIEMIRLNPQSTFILGGYDPISAPNVIWCDSIKDACDYLGVPYMYGTDYSLFKRTKCIPRLTMSKGCRNKCSFCTIEKNVVPLSERDIMTQVESFVDLDFDLVYIDDKTFGQCSNYTSIGRIYHSIREFNRNFVGFVIQTTASQKIDLDLPIYAIEIGVETYNDPILRFYNKPSSERLIDTSMARIHDKGIKYIPNIISGLQGETQKTYERTISFVKNSRALFINLYDLALYGTDDNDEHNNVKSLRNTKENELSLWFKKQLL